MYLERSPITWKKTGGSKYLKKNRNPTDHKIVKINYNTKKNSLRYHGTRFDIQSSMKNHQFKPGLKMSLGILIDQREYRGDSWRLRRPALSQTSEIEKICKRWCEKLSWEWKNNNEMRDKNSDLAREEEQGNMKLTLILIVVGELETIPKSLEKWIQYL